MATLVFNSPKVLVQLYSTKINNIISRDFWNLVTWCVRAVNASRKGGSVSWETKGRFELAFTHIFPKPLAVWRINKDKFRRKAFSAASGATFILHLYPRVWYPGLPKVCNLLWWLSAAICLSLSYLYMYIRLGVICLQYLYSYVGVRSTTLLLLTASRIIFDVRQCSEQWSIEIELMYSVFGIGMEEAATSKSKAGNSGGTPAGAGWMKCLKAETWLYIWYDRIEYAGSDDEW